MNILGMEIPDEIAKAIVAKAKTEELFIEFIKELEGEYKWISKQDFIARKKKNAEEEKCKLAIYINYYHSDIMTCGDLGRKENVEIEQVDINNSELRNSATRFYKHIKKLYDIVDAQYSPIFIIDDSIIQFEFKTSSKLTELFSDLKESNSEWEIELNAGTGIVKIKV